MNAQITVVECNDHNFFERRILRWKWWWKVYIRDHSVRSGFASTRARAEAKAEKAARKLARTQAATPNEYTIQLDQPRP
ncbi:hypothetical protein [Streptomyces spiralis]